MRQPAQQGDSQGRVDASTAGSEPRYTSSTAFKVICSGHLGHIGYFLAGRRRESHRVNSHFGYLGLVVAHRFLQKVRARTEISLNNLRLLYGRDARPPPLRVGAKALSYLAKFRGGPKLFVKI